MPPDGSRYEIIDGELFVTPVPDVYHQRAQMALIAHVLPYVRSMRLELFAAQGIDTERKHRLHFTHGVREYLAVDIGARCAQVWTAQNLTAQVTRDVRRRQPFADRNPLMVDRVAGFNDVHGLK